MVVFLVVVVVEGQALVTAFKSGSVRWIQGLIESFCQLDIESPHQDLDSIRFDNGSLGEYQTVWCNPSDLDVGFS